MYHNFQLILGTPMPLILMTSLRTWSHWHLSTTWPSSRLVDSFSNYKPWKFLQFEIWQLKVCLCELKSHFTVHKLLYRVLRVSQINMAFLLAKESSGGVLFHVLRFFNIVNGNQVHTKSKMYFFKGRRVIQIGKYWIEI